MSGGHFDYNQYKIDQIACDIEQLIIYNDSTKKDEFGNDIGNHFLPKTIERLKEALHTLRLAYAYAHRIDWLVSGDDNEDNFHKRLEHDLERVKEENEDDEF